MKEIEELWDELKSIREQFAKFKDRVGKAPRASRNRHLPKGLSVRVKVNSQISEPQKLECYITGINFLRSTKEIQKDRVTIIRNIINSFETLYYISIQIFSL